MQTYYEILDKKFREDTGLEISNPNNPSWLSDYQAKVQEKAQEEAAARAQAAAKAPPVSAETATSQTQAQAQAQAQPSSIIKVPLRADDPLAPTNYFAPETLKSFNLGQREARFEKWMKEHADTYLTPEGKTAYQRERRRAAPDNLFGIAPSDGPVDKVRNVGLSLGQGVLGSIEAITSLFGADNVVSAALRNVGSKLGDYKTAESKISGEVIAQRIKEAKASGSTEQEIAAYLNALAESPLEILAQGIGSFATLGFGKAAQLARAGQLLSKGATAAEVASKASKVGQAVNVAVGAAQGVGGVKSGQYEQVFEQAKAAGISEELARKVATKAQEYNLANLPQHALALAFGAIANGVGIEAAFLRIGVKGVGKEAGKGAGYLARAKEAAKGAVKEAITEGPQNAQQQYAQNQASIRAGTMTPDQAMQGVVGSGVQGAAVGALLAGPVDLLSSGTTATRTPPTAPGTTPGAGGAPSTPAGDVRSTPIEAARAAHAMPDGPAKEAAIETALTLAEIANSDALKAGRPQIFSDEELNALNDGKFAQFSAQPAPAPSQQPTGQQGDTNAVQEQSAGQGVLRSQGPQVGLQENGQGDQGAQVPAAAGQAQGQTQEVVPTPPAATTQVVEAPSTMQELVGRTVDYQGIQGSLMSTPTGYGVLSNGEMIPVESGASGAKPADIGITLPQVDATQPGPAPSAPPGDTGTVIPPRPPAAQAQAEAIVATAAARRQNLQAKRAARSARRAKKKLERQTRPDAATAPVIALDNRTAVVTPPEVDTDQRAELKTETQRDAYDFYVQTLLDAVAGPNPTPEQYAQAQEQVQYLLAQIEAKLLNQQKNKPLANQTPFLFENKPVSLQSFMKLLIQTAEDADAYRRAVSSLETQPAATDPQVMGQSDLTITQAHNMAMADAMMEDLRTEYGDAVAENILVKLEDAMVASGKPITPTTIRDALEAELVRVDAAVQAGAEAELDMLVNGLEQAYGPERTAEIVQSAVAKQGADDSVQGILPILRDEIRNAEQTRKEARRAKDSAKAVAGAGSATTKPNDRGTTKGAAPSRAAAPAKLRVGNQLPEAVEIDGIEYSTRNSEGKPITASVEAFKNFVKWFGDSKVTDNGMPMREGGRPLVLYHGTHSDITEYDPSYFGTATDEGFMGPGFYATNKPEFANKYASKPGKQGGNILPVYLMIERPFSVPSGQDYLTTSQLQEFDAANSDGGVLRNWLGKDDDYIEFSAVNPPQIKSAIGNDGQFNPGSSDIRYRHNQTAKRQGESKETLLDEETLRVAMDKGLKAGLETLAKNTKQLRVAEVARKLAPILEGVTFTSGPIDAGPYRNPRAGWFPQTLEVRMSSNFDGQWTDVDMLHEATHAAVDRIMHLPDTELTVQQVKAKKELHKLWQDASTTPELSEEYGVTDLHEFLAEFFGNQDFQIAVAKYVPTPKENAFKRGVQLMLRMLGIRAGDALNTGKVDSLINDLFMPPEVRIPDAAKLRLNPTPRKEQERLSAIQNMGLAIGETFVDYGIRGLDEIQSEEESARNTNPKLARALNDVRKEFTLRDIAGISTRLSKDTVDVVDKLIRELSSATGLDANDLRYQASRYQVAKHALHQNARKAAELRDSVDTAQYMLDLHEAGQTILGAYQKEVNALTAKIDAYFERGLGQQPDLVSRTRLNKMFGEMISLVEKLSVDLDQIGLQATPKGRTATLLKQALVQHAYDARTAGDVRRAIMGAKRFRDDIAMMLGPRETISQVHASAVDALMNFRAAHAEERTVGADGELVTRVPLMGGLRNIEAQKILADTDADPNAKAYKELADAYKQAFITLTNQAVDGGVITREAADDFFARFPEYVSLMGRSDADDDTVILETNAKGFLSSAEGSVHMLHSNDTFTNLVARTAKLASEIANQRVGASVYEAAQAGSKLFARTVPMGGRTPYIKVRVNGQSLFYAPTTDAGKRMFGLHPGQGLVDHKGMRALTQATTLLGRSTTQAVALFAPVNALFRDIPTRMFNFVGRKDDLRRPDGSRIGVQATRGRMLLNVMSPFTLAEAIAYAWADKEGHYMARFLTTGGHLTFSKMLKTEAEVSKTFARGSLAKIQNGVAAASSLLHRWNSAFETIAVLASFKALTDGGMSDRDAGYLTLDMMNFRKSGGFTGAYLRPFFMFVNPAAQDALQFKRALYNRGKFNFQALAEVGALATIAAAIYGMARDMDDDDELGGKNIDALTTRDLYNNIVIPDKDKPGSYVKIPLGFGWIQTAWQAGVAKARYDKGIITQADWVADVTSAVTKNFLITGAPEVAFTKDPALFFTQMLTPDAANPIVQTVTNKNWAGQPITGLMVRDKFDSEQGKWKTPEAYKKAATRIREITGIDVAPENVKTVAEGYLIGPMAAGLDAFVKAEEDKKAKGLFTESSIPAWHRSLGLNKFYSVTDETRSTNAQFYTEQRKMDELVKEANSLSRKASKRESADEKAARFASTGVMTVDQALLHFEIERKLAGIASDSREAYLRQKDGEDMLDTFTELAGKEIEAKREYVLKMRGLN